MNYYQENLVHEDWAHFRETVRPQPKLETCFNCTTELLRQISKSASAKVQSLNCESKHVLRGLARALDT
jgi:hypothetical protein